jgi:ATP-dependent helicase YprA (DUF1998 family)
MTPTSRPRRHGGAARETAGRPHGVASHGRRPARTVAVWIRGAGARARSERGQATVEFVALLPLLLTAGLAGAAVLAGQAAVEHAGQAAQAGAMALQAGTDARVAARSSLPAAARSRATIVLRDRRISVQVRPGIPIAPLADLLTARVTADAGPEPAP